ncbi:MAG: response regulator [Halobacteriovoraceae bacterium]|jgi:DNA-binding response OmpR family regulator|nr:response regulator [Halobacteriovoraceae bacterium]MBT5092689.1 response regulator [Halobacteriovoraceae bacterium]
MSAKLEMLIVDDSAMERKLLENIFSKQGFEISSVESGEACLEYLGMAEKVDIVLLDYAMEGISGLETLKKIREKKTHLELPVLMVTGKNKTGDIVETFSAGANDFITKPVDIEVAISRVNTQMSLSSLSRQAANAKEIHAINAMITTYNHEINNPLTIAMGSYEIFKRKRRDEDLEKINTALKRIADIVSKIEGVVDSGVEFEEYIESANLLKKHKG